jgi:hypothetical protein
MASARVSAIFFDEVAAAAAAAPSPFLFKNSETAEPDVVLAASTRLFAALAAAPLPPDAFRKS